MNLKTYRGKSMADALDQVKKDLGKDAVILHTRAYRVGSVLGVGGHHEYEITASDQASARRSRPVREPAGLVAATLPLVGEPDFVPESFERLGEPEVVIARGAASTHDPIVELKLPQPVPTAPAIKSTRVDFSPTDPSTIDQLRGELGSIKRMVGQLLGSSRRAAIAGSIAGEALSVAGLADPLCQVYLALQDAGVSHDIVESVTGAVRDELSPAELADTDVVRSACVRTLAAMLPVVGSIAKPVKNTGPVTVALVGPTGVGKTTTIAKLAALYKLRHAQKVGLVTSDTYRIAAVDQLRTYAGIIGLPIKVALTPEDVSAACESLQDCDVILLDTAGRSQHDSHRLSELSAFIAAARPQQTHLVLSAAAAEPVLLAAAERFRALQPDRLLLTKLDEAVTFGSLVNVTRKVALPVSFVTTGQEVPDHLELADSERLARLALRGELRA